MENTNKKSELIERLPQIWLKFTYVIMVLAAVALLASFCYSIYADGDWSWFLYTIISCFGAMFLCAIIQLLVKIERNTRK